MGEDWPTKKEMDDAMRAGELAAPVPLLSINEYQDVIASAEGSIEQVSSSTNLHRAFIPDDYPRISEINFALDLSSIKPSRRRTHHREVTRICRQNKPGTGILNLEFVRI